MIESLLRMVGYHTPTITEKLAAWAGPVVIEGGKTAVEWTVSATAAYVGILGGLKVGSKVAPVMEKGLNAAFATASAARQIAKGVLKRTHLRKKGVTDVASPATEVGAAAVAA
jgi:xanthosine utilization system XapX-like protein